MTNFKQFEQRKKDHINLALMDANQANECMAFDDWQLMHEALPDFDFSDITISSTRFGHVISKPFFVSSMTAGHQDSININQRLMEACEHSAWAMGVGSQRRELSDLQAANEWLQLRKAYPKVSLFSNLGIAQLIHCELDAIKRLTDCLQAEGIFIHCNPLQECIQPEGTPQYKGCWQALEHLVKSQPVPVIVKETGCGFSKSTLERLNNIGVAAVDISGLGGTHWGRIEGFRTKGDVKRQQTAISFKNWGIETLESTQIATTLGSNYEVWGSGGVKNGLNAAKLFALGVKAVGFAKPMLEAALQSVEALQILMETIEYELKVALFCTGSMQLTDLLGKLRFKGL